MLLRRTKSISSAYQRNQENNNPDSSFSLCPKLTKNFGYKSKNRWLIWLFPITGLLSLFWFLIRVIPKPTRATYPCQRFALPLASSFIVWIVGFISSTLIYRKARSLLQRSHYVVAAFLFVVAITTVWLSLSITAEDSATAAFTPSDLPNNPIGIAKGIYPGRVVWTHDPASTTWDGSTGDWWDDDNTNQEMVDFMISKTIQTLTGQPNDTDAWDALFKHFNQTRGFGDFGYQQGEKIAIKINMNQATSGLNWNKGQGMPSPHVIDSLLHQLIYTVGVQGSAITIYDASRNIGNPIYNKIRSYSDPNFQDITFVSGGGNGRIAASRDTSKPLYTNAGTAYFPRCVTEAKYLFNMALLRPHSLFGVTLCAKNHFGSTFFPSQNSWTPSPMHNYGLRGNPMGSYNCLVDLNGHNQLSGKTLLYMIDGLYGARNQSSNVLKWVSFGDNWSSSIFTSQDPIAIDSVGLDFLRYEDEINQDMSDVTGNPDNYLHEAALANNPPSGTFYDPEGDEIRLESLGVHEHWNNPIDKQYSRNLGIGEGIELVAPSLAIEDGPIENMNSGNKYNYIQHAINEADPCDFIVVNPGTYDGNIDFIGKKLTLSSVNPNSQAIVAGTVINGGAQAVTFTSGEDSNSVLIGFTITGAQTGIYCHEASPTIQKCRIMENKENGIELYWGSNPLIANCEIVCNGSSGIEMVLNSGRYKFYNYPVLNNSVIAENSQDGISGGKPIIINCTITANGQRGISSVEPLVENSIIYYNSLNSDIVQIESENSVVNYSNIQGGWPGEGNIDSDPLFAMLGYWANVDDPNVIVEPNDPNAVWIEGDYHLKSQAGRWDTNSQSWVHDDVMSPCIDAGNPNSDLGDELWPHGKKINMGAYGGTSEASMSSSQVGDARDLNNDDLIAWDDVLLLADKWDSNDVPLKEDLNLDGIVDVNDLDFFKDNWSDDSNNTEPVFNFIDDQYIAVDNELSFSVSALDNDGDELTYMALCLPAGAIFNEQIFSWIPEQVSIYQVIFIVSDHKSLDYLTVQIIVDGQ